MTGISLAISLTLLISPTILILASGEPTDLIGYQDEKQQWILGGLSLIRRIDCTHVTSINPQECAKIRIAPASRFVAYVASLEQVESGHLQMTHPDLQDDIVETRDGNLTGILVLDPLADRAFGHPLFIFRIFTFNGNREERLRQCLDKRGLMYKSECIHQEVKSGCPYIFLSAGQPEEVIEVPPERLVCEYQFLPRVTSTNSPKNLLQCISHAAPCFSTFQQKQRRKRLHRRRVILPTLLHGTHSWSRDPQWINPLTRRETSSSFLPHRPVRASPSTMITQFSSKHDDSGNSDDAICSSYDRCDHAVLLNTRFEDGEDADVSANGRTQRRHLIDKLRSLGFSSRLLAVYPPEPLLSKSYHFFNFMAKRKETPRNISIKSAFRSRLQKLCHTPRCVSTLFLYFNNFVLPNGDMLIGGSNNTFTNERYSVSEFLSDLSGCQASLVFTVVDQNFGGILLDQLKSRANEFSNLILLCGTRQANALESDLTVEKKPPPEFFYPLHYAFRLGHYDLYGVEDLLTYAVENLPLSQILVSDIEKQIQTHYPQLELGSFYGARAQAHTSALFSKPLYTSQHEGGFLQGRLSGQARPMISAPRRFIAGCVSLSPIDWLRNYLPSTDQSQSH